MKPEMSAVLVIVRDVIKEQSLQVAGVQWDHVIEQLAATASYPALGDTILPGAFEGGSHGGYLQGSNGCRDLRPASAAVEPSLGNRRSGVPLQGTGL